MPGMPGVPGGLPMRPGMPGMPTPTLPGAMGGQGVGASGLPGISGGLATTDGSIPSRPVRTDVPQNTVEQNVILYEAARIRNEELVKAGLLPRMPVHPLIRGMDGGGQNAPPPTQ